MEALNNDIEVAKEAADGNYTYSGFGKSSLDKKKQTLEEEVGTLSSRGDDPSGVANWSGCGEIQKPEEDFRQDPP